MAINSCNGLRKQKVAVKYRKFYDAVLEIRSDLIVSVRFRLSINALIIRMLE